MNSVFPNFVSFKLYRKSLYNSHFYREAKESLLNLEIKFKQKRIKTLSSDLNRTENCIKETLSWLDFCHIKVIIGKILNKYYIQIERIHNKKLYKLGINFKSSSSINPDDIIFNFSDYALTKREKAMLSLGLDFKLPCFRPNFTQMFLPFEKLCKYLKYSTNNSDTFEGCCIALRNLVHGTYLSSKNKNTWFPFFKKSDLLILKKLGENKNLIVCRPDKGKGVVILNRHDYVAKMNDILSDTKKFNLVTEPHFKVATRIEDKINRFLVKIKNSHSITNELYSDLHCTGTSFGILYGLPKVHKGNPVPLRPILAAYDLPNYKLAKFLVPILSPLTTNEHSIINSYSFSESLHSKVQANKFLVSYDVESLFTNIPLHETIEIIISKLFPTSDSYYFGFNKKDFKQLLELSVLDTHFIFDGKLYKQTEGCAMGSPLGPVFANIFMCKLENEFLRTCPQEFKPSIYRRYVDDTFVAFNNHEESLAFLNFINNKHPNIKFTMDTEQDDKLPFLDLLIKKENGHILTSVFRKKTFTGLGTNFYSYTPLKYKITAIKTLIHRGFKHCSNWLLFHSEMDYLQKYLSNNSFPGQLFFRILHDFLESHFKPRLSIVTVPKDIRYISVPYLGVKQGKFDMELKKIISKFYPFLDLRISPVNPVSISSFFKFKDPLPVGIRSRVIYMFTCPACCAGTYIGCTIRHLRARFSAHKGISHRTGEPLGVKEHSNIRNHASKCKIDLNIKDFKILSSGYDANSLLIVESLLIKQKHPSLNTDSTSVPLFLV